MRRSRAWLRAGIVAGTATAACSFSAGKLRGGDGGGGSDGSGTGSDAPLPDAGPCQVLGDVCADGFTLEQCTTVGQIPTRTMCGWGCSTTSGAHCAVLQPAGGGVGSDNTLHSVLSGFDAVTLGSASVVDSSAKTILLPAAGSNFGVGSANGVVYFQFKSLTIDGALTLQGSNAIALVADGAITINARMDMRGTCLTTTLSVGGAAGPGGFKGGAQKVAGAGPGGGTGGAGDTDAGGGGGGYGADGGNGAKAIAGGTAFGSASIVMLVGGAGGGGGGGGGGHSAPGGGGGGALQLISNTSITIASNGIINAGGCGGFSADSNDSAGGGGAGGTILLEAPTILQQGKLAVNGGGGGGADTGVNELGSNRGADGSDDRVAAAGHTGDGSGGDGGFATMLGGGSGTLGNHGGGGGGAVGRIRFNTRTGSATLTYMNSLLSPGIDDTPTTCTVAPATVQ